MKLSQYQKAKTEKEKKKAIKLYKQGYTLREVSKIVGYSHEWVRTQINQLSTPPLDKN